MEGFVHSVQTLGTLDGPGVRFVVFLQGCNLRCAYCHNPDTWVCGTGKQMTAQTLFDQLLRYRSYFGQKGGVTVTGGEPLLQADFVTELFSLCKVAGIHTALDTSGSILNEQTHRLLDLTDLTLLDIKMTTDAAYRQHIGCSVDGPLAFLEELQRRNLPTWIRHVVVPTVTDSEENITALGNLLGGYSCIEKVELLPFRKLCVEKYQQLGIDFPFGSLPEADENDVARLSALLENCIKQQKITAT